MPRSRHPASSFVLPGMFRALRGVTVLRWSGMLLGAGAAANPGAFDVWGTSRTQGMPLGPHAGAAEAAGTTDLIASGMEAVLILAALAALVLRTSRPEPGNAAFDAADVAALTATVATAAAVSESGNHGHGEPGGRGGSSRPEDGHGHGGAESDQPGASPSADSETSASPWQESAVPADGGHDHEH